MIFVVVGEILLGWLLADLLTGIFHWWEDQYGKEDWFIIGSWIIAPNRLHHKNPLAFVANGFWGRNRATIITTILVGISLYLWVGLSVFLITFLVGVAFSNEIHRYAHQPAQSPKWVKVLQEIGFFQSSKEHSRHHKPPQQTHFCVLTDWLNPILEAINFWRKLERIFKGNNATSHL